MQTRMLTVEALRTRECRFEEDRWEAEGAARQLEDGEKPYPLVVVRRAGEEFYDVVSGIGRLDALKAAGMAMVPCLVLGTRAPGNVELRQRERPTVCGRLRAPYQLHWTCPQCRRERVDDLAADYLALRLNGEPFRLTLMCFGADGSECSRRSVWLRLAVGLKVVED